MSVDVAWTSFVVFSLFTFLITLAILKDDEK